MSNNIEGKVVVITGASSGLGEATPPWPASDATSASPPDGAVLLSAIREALGRE